MDRVQDNGFPQHVIDFICQEEVDLMEEEGLEVDPARLERRLAHRITNLTPQEVEELTERSSAERASRRLAHGIATSVRRAADRMRGR